jgi:hypothetical protein
MHAALDSENEGDDVEVVERRRVVRKDGMELP